MSDHYQFVFKILPCLFHFHSPQLPGYESDDVVHGIADYSPDTAILAQLNIQLDSDAAASHAIPRIAGLYSMGSTSSLGQSESSDLDIWICIEQPLSNDEKSKLLRKCQLIEAWAKTLDVELLFFIVDINRFRNNYHDCLIGDNCGSAQHILLLEEFYRTANLLAGKLLLWFRVPPDLIIDGIQYPNYESCIEVLVNSKAINPDKWIDFGSLISLSAQEYFGASLWQLYKSIDSPYKAVLKSLLLEAYSWEYPQTQFIAQQMKQQLHAFKLDHFYLDPYYMMLEKVTHYLLAIDDHERLELARQCFYIKINEKLSLKASSLNWRRQILQTLVSQWGWDNNKLMHLDSCQQWKITQVRQVYNDLLNAMMTSYRNLLSFGRRNNLDSLISPQDLAVLTRKLYATYEVLPGKVSIINPNISTELAEQALTFIHVNEDRVNRVGWYVYDKEPNMKYTTGSKYLEFSPSLLKLVAWCYFNNLIMAKTSLFLWDNGKRDDSKLLQLIADLTAYFPIKVPAATEEALSGSFEIRHLAMIINLEQDPTENLSSSVEDLEPLSIDVLNYGEGEISLIGSIDLLYRNSWNEIRTLHFTGQSSVLDALQTLLNLMHKNSDVPDSLAIFCYSQHLQSTITQQLETLTKRCVELRLSSTQQNLVKFKPLRFAGKSWGLFFERLGVSVHRFDNTVDFYGAISNNKLQGTALNILDNANELPEAIDSVACEGIIQFFFEDTKAGFDLYILNEFNQIEIYRQCDGSKHRMIKDVNEFYTLSDDRFTFASSSSVNFNLPQFYEIIVNNDGKRQVIPFV
ncbi:class I adenylate cyclase [Utexia brackfieldae]|uniref:class I adenylate cyclase n=1 Tax=Utexia brackfieldae TaxID=3074108 RepID=UPI00370DC9B8